MKTSLCILAFLFTGLLTGLHAAVVANETDAERMTRCLKVYLPEGWKLQEITPGPQEIPGRWGKTKEGCLFRFTGPHTPKPESVEVFIIPREHHLKKSLFVFNWFRPNYKKSARLWRNDAVEILGHADHAESWPDWKFQLRKILGELGN
ncbi:MAG: hypothetical protein ABI443_13945 [Chthoniobacterales bacterium]